MASVLSKRYLLEVPVVATADVEGKRCIACVYSPEIDSFTPVTGKKEFWNYSDFNFSRNLSRHPSLIEEALKKTFLDPDEANVIGKLPQTYRETPHKENNGTTYHGMANIPYILESTVHPDKVFKPEDFTEDVFLLPMDRVLEAVAQSEAPKQGFYMNIGGMRCKVNYAVTSIIEKLQSGKIEPINSEEEMQIFQETIK